MQLCAAENNFCERAPILSKLSRSHHSVLKVTKPQGRKDMATTGHGMAMARARQETKDEIFFLQLPPVPDAGWSEATGELAPPSTLWPQLCRTLSGAKRFGQLRWFRDLGIVCSLRVEGCAHGDLPLRKCANPCTRGLGRGFSGHARALTRSP